MFADSVNALRAAGWVNVFPLRRGQKSPPPTGVTGARRFTPSGADLAEWADLMPGGNIAVAMPRAITADDTVWDVVALDVDDYAKGGIVKTGLATVSRIEAAAGAEFPPTVKITSRGENGSGKYVYRLPRGVELVGALASVELIQWFHRYAVAPPSTNPDSGGSRFEWRTGARPAPGRSGVVTRRVPRPRDAAVLPAALVDHLRRDRPRVSPVAVDRDTRRAFYAAMPDGLSGIPCAAVRRRYQRAQTDLRAAKRRAAQASRSSRGGGLDDPPGRHDTAVAHVLALLRLGEQGHLGVRPALRHLRADFLDVTADRAEAATAEWARMVRPEAVGLILATPTDPDQRQCLCPEGLAAMLATADNPRSAAAQIGISVPSVIAAVAHPLARAAVITALGGDR